MGYRIDSTLWDSVFAVPGKLVDEHLKLCGGAALKALLLVVRKNGDVQPEQISDFLGLPVADVLDALNYWIHLGVLTETTAEQPRATEGLHPATNTSHRPQQKPKEDIPSAKQPTPEPGSFRRKLAPKQINEMSQKDKNIAFLLQESQTILGKPITPVATDTITGLYSYYGMEPEVILMLLQYCVSQNKDSMRYVETVAAGWIKAGIDTHEKAEQEIVKAFEREKLENIIRRLFGIHDRTLIASERKYVSDWKEQGMSVDLIGLAYERTIEQKGKLSFAYINGILQNWRAKGINSTGQAMEEMRGKNTSPLQTSNSADLDEMEQIYKYGDI